MPAEHPCRATITEKETKTAHQLSQPAKPIQAPTAHPAKQDKGASQGNNGSSVHNKAAIQTQLSHVEITPAIHTETQSYCQLCREVDHPGGSAAKKQWTAQKPKPPISSINRHLDTF